MRDTVKLTVCLAATALHTFKVADFDVKASLLNKSEKKLELTLAS